MQTSFFSIKRLQNVTSITPTSKVAAGMEAKYLVTFRPESKEDYSSDIVVVTEREKFLVQVKAIGARAELDFPAYYNFDMCPVGCTTQKTFLVHNVGEKLGAFTVEAGEAGGPFVVSPKEATLGCGESMQFSVSFSPSDTVMYAQALSFKFLDGQVCETMVEGGGAELDVHLKDEKVYLNPTFISRSSQKRFKLVNNSKVPVRFSFQRYMDKGRDEDERSRAMLDLDTEVRHTRAFAFVDQACMWLN